MQTLWLGTWGVEKSDMFVGGKCFIFRVSILYIRKAKHQAKDPAQYTEREEYFSLKKVASQTSTSARYKKLKN